MAPNLTPRCQAQLYSVTSPPPPLPPPPPPPCAALKNCGARDWDLTSIIRGRRPPSQEGCLASGSIGASGKSDVSAKSQESESRPLGFTICFMSYSSQHAWLSNFSISSAADVNTSAWGVFPRELRGL